jgi:hypothetical protein
VDRPPKFTGKSEQLRERAWQELAIIILHETLPAGEDMRLLATQTSDVTDGAPEQKEARIRLEAGTEAKA